MASFLLDENISHIVVEQLLLKEPDARIVSIKHWRSGLFMGVDDASILETACADGLTLLTYDVSTIQPLLREWSEEGISHGGVVFIDDKSIASYDYGGLIRAILELWNRTKEDELKNTQQYLTRIDS